MNTAQKPVSEMCQVFTCGRCAMAYHEYTQLLEHLYWRHGTESKTCKKCTVKKWQYAVHLCHVLPVVEVEENDETQTIDDTNDSTNYCLCGDTLDVPMIGCDGPRCVAQWFHYPCVGVVNPPEGDWYCPRCVPTYTQVKRWK